MPAVPEMTPEELVLAVERGQEIHVLDVRAPQRLASGRIDIVPDERFHNVRGSEVLARPEIGLPPSARVAVVCGYGNDSRRIAQFLNERGFRAASVAGGMVGWMRTVIRRELAPPPELDRFVQLDRIGKGALGYVLVSGREALVIDPPRHLEPVAQLLAKARARLVGVADTHAHADYLSGGPALARAQGVPYYLHPADAVSPYDGRPARLEYTPLLNGQRLRVGRAEIEALHTPGHTEGSVTFRLGDRFALTGDFIFVASVGRPDLGDRTEEWTRVLFRSLAEAKRSWPKALAICPAHYALAMERGADRAVGAPFGEILRTNEPLRIAAEEEFARWIRARAGRFPDSYRRIKAINLGLEQADESEADELEAGRNECALS